MMHTLFVAVKRGDRERVEQLLAQATAKIINNTDYRSRTALHLAIELGHLDVAEMLIGQQGIELHAEYGGFNALHLAAELGYDKIVALLLEKNPKLVATRGHNDLTPLHLAVIGGHAAIVERLLAMNVEMREEGKQNPVLQLAVEYGHEEIAAILVKSVQSTNERFGRDMFECAVSKGYDRIATQLLAENPRLIDHAENCYRFTALQLAARYGRDMLVAQLLAEQPHSLDNIMHLAAANGHEKIVSRLLAVKPALASETDSDGRTPLHVAQHARVVDVLLAHSPELINVEDRYRQTALNVAVSRGHCDAVAGLLAHKAAGANEEMLWDILRWAGASKNPGRLVELLLTHKPELITSVNSSGESVLHGVLRARSITSKEVLEKVYQMSPPGAFDRRNSCGDTPLQVAIHSFNKAGIEFVQWKLSFDEVRGSCAFLSALLDEIYAMLVHSMNTDVTGIVWDYLGLSFRLPRRKRS